jgi:hypothetical protein
MCRGKSVPPKWGRRLPVIGRSDTRTGTLRSRRWQEKDNADEKDNRVESVVGEQRARVQRCTDQIVIAASRPKPPPEPVKIIPIRRGRRKD